MPRPEMNIRKKADKIRRLKNWENDSEAEKQCLSKEANLQLLLKEFPDNVSAGVTKPNAPRYAGRYTFMKQTITTEGKLHKGDNLYKRYEAAAQAFKAESIKVRGGKWTVEKLQEYETNYGVEFLYEIRVIFEAA